jgi:exosortase E/protease (VPEID-CTERM system)
MLGCHFGSLAVFGICSAVLFGGRAPEKWAGGAAVVFVASGLLAMALACLAFLPPDIWWRLFGSTGYTWAYAGATAIFICWLGNQLRLLWGPAVRVTFVLVKLMLTPFLGQIVSDPGTATIGSPSFNVVIAPECSGLEGVGLMLVFGVVWLWLSRHDLRFPQALWLVPVSLVTAFLLNSVRIAGLILIGNAGAPGVALGGFHSQAGWIAFNAVALGLMASSQHVPWIARDQAAPPSEGSRGASPTTLYLAPFVAVLAAGMISRALTGQFEWLYSLRLCAVAAVLWRYRKHYAAMDWAFSWLAPTAGAVVFALWIALDRWVASTSASGTVPGLNPDHGAAWIAWLVLRILGAVAAVPIAEELAFRGFLLRRLVATAFDKVDYRDAPVLALLGSSVAFGLMHGTRWLAGALAGLVYALVLRRRGRIGEAVAAHATTNALLAIWVIARGDWRLW